MSDTEKGVSVTPANKSAAKNYARATNVRVTDGHLFVMGGGDTVAVYAPNTWISADVHQ